MCLNLPIIIIVYVRLENYGNMNVEKEVTGTKVTGKKDTDLGKKTSHKNEIDLYFSTFC